MACPTSFGLGSLCKPTVCPTVSARRASSLEASSSHTDLQGRRHGCTSYWKEMEGDGLLEIISSSSHNAHSGRPLNSVVTMSYLPAGHSDWWRKPNHPHGGLFGPPGSPLDWSSPDFRLSDPLTSMSDWEDEEEEDGAVLATDLSYMEEGSFSKKFVSRGSDAGVPVYVMLPLDSICMNNTISRPRAFMASLAALKSAGVYGVMMDVWWGIVEREPGVYQWDAYKELVAMVKESGLKLQAVMSFHQCGGNVGDHCTIPLPPWVLQEMEDNPDIAYTDRSGGRNCEYISLGCDEVPVLFGRTPMEVYSDFMRCFRDSFREYLGSVITEIQVGMGPAGELRYPSYPEGNDRWRFPGIGEFQCYDKYMLRALAEAAESTGRPLWGLGGPHDSGTYKQWPDETGFFHTNGSWKTPYGEFFMQWYSDMLLRHGDRILSSARRIFRSQVHVSGKVAGIHWHYWTHSHAAELTAGYYNTVYRDGYLPLAHLFAKHNATLNFTCFEMRDQEQPMWAGCSPEGLLRQVVGAAKQAGVRISGENALSRYDASAHEQIVRQSRLQLDGMNTDEPMATFTFLRMSERLFRPEHWTNFVLFVRQMKEGRTFQPWEEAHHNSHLHIRSIGPLSQAAAELLVL